MQVLVESMAQCRKFQSLGCRIHLAGNLPGGPLV